MLEYLYIEYIKVGSCERVCHGGIMISRVHRIFKINISGSAWVLFYVKILILRTFYFMVKIDLMMFTVVDIDKKVVDFNKNPRALLLIKL